ncbi:hypothetical protein COBT_002784 [Conglomerata obtusa]
MFVTLLFACINRKTIEVIKPKEDKTVDPDFNLQQYILKKCKKNQSPAEKNTQNTMKRFITLNAYVETMQNLPLDDISIFKKRGFVQCFSEIAEHKALKALCPEFERQYFEFDLIEEFALLEYKKCVDDKNKQHRLVINFEVPRMLQNEVKSITDALLNH